MADVRALGQWSSSFGPRREHGRFCSGCCRAAWNREHTGDLKAGASALVWSITAMSDTTERLTQVRAWDRPRAFAVIGEVVWWVTIVDATLVRHHPDAYDNVMTGQAPAQRQLVEGTLAGLRFVRNRIGDEADLGEFIEPGEPGPGPGQRPIPGWPSKPLPEPALRPLSSRGQAWEMTRDRAYQAQLAGHTAGETFGRAAEVPMLAAANTPAITRTSAQAGR